MNTHLKQTFIFLAGFISTWSAFAQVTQTVLVEHFTNTRCSVCASRNPGFYNNLNAQSNVLHVAIHPSAPYSNCLLNQHNTAENDARTQFYGVYGSTPRLVIDGNTIPASSDYSNSNLFNAYLNKTSPISISVNLTETGNDITAKVVVKAVAAHTFTNLLISGFLVEELVNYAAPNREQQHHDVFRKGIFAITGETFVAPANGDSIVFEKTINKNSTWVLNQIYAIITVQQPSKQSVQAAQSLKLTGSTGIGSVTKSPGVSPTIYPNPANNTLTININDNELTQVRMFDNSGKLIFEDTFTSEQAITTTNFPSGIYHIIIATKSGITSSKINILH